MQKEKRKNLESKLVDSENNTNNTKTKKRRNKKKKEKSYIAKVMASRKEKPVIVFILAIIAAFILDILRIIKNIILGLIAIILACGIVVAVLVFIKVEPIYTEYDKFATKTVNESSYDDFKLTESSYVYDYDGKQIAKLKATMDSEYLTYEQIPSDVVDAFIAVEDRSFWTNPGVDAKGLVRVVYDYIKTKGEEMHGASTITQQLARNIYLTHEVSIERKAKEMLLALKLTSKYTKEEIMEFYCNDICFANAYYGIQAASNGYFNKNVDELSLSQMAYLCAIPNSPEYYNPYKNPDRALKRRDKILGDMLELGYITKYEYNKAIAEEIEIEKPEYTFNDYMTTYAVDCATQYLMKQNGFKFKYKFDDMDSYNSYYEKYNDAYETAKNKLYTGGYKVYTSLNPKIQKKMQKILDKQLAFNKEINDTTGVYALQGAMTVIDNSTGKVIAVVGGRSQKDNEQGSYSLNRAFQSYRQPGSTIKPLVVYAPALMKGYTPNTTVNNISISEAKKKGVDVQKLTGTPMTFRYALEKSINGVAWRTFDKFGAKYCMSFLNEMKFSKICPDDYYNASSLGGLTNGVTTVEMAAAYATLENHGGYREATCIASILDRDGNETYKDSGEKQVYTAKASDTMTDMMEGVLKSGTAYGLNWYGSTDMIAACKTGTTNKSKDGWLCGYTPYYTVAVWVGYDLPKALNNLYGSTYPGQIWKQSMLSLIKDKKVKTNFKNADYAKYGEEESITDVVEFEVPTTLPQSAYETYLPGRSDSEVLSPGYTVLDYRKDRVIGESVQQVIDLINSLQEGDAQVEELYKQGCKIVDAIYSVKYTAEMKGKLNQAYYNKK